MTDTILWIGGFLVCLVMTLYGFIHAPIYIFNNSCINIFLTSLIAPFYVAMSLTLIRPVQSWRWIIASFSGPLMLLLLGGVFQNGLWEGLKLIIYNSLNLYGLYHYFVWLISWFYLFLAWLISSCLGAVIGLLMRKAFSYLNN